MKSTLGGLLVARITSAAYSRATKAVLLSDSANQDAGYDTEEIVQIWNDAVVSTCKMLGHPQFVIKAVRVYAVECGGGYFEVDYVDFFIGGRKRRVCRFFDEHTSEVSPIESSAIQTREVP